MNKLLKNMFLNIDFSWVYYYYATLLFLFCLPSHSSVSPFVFPQTISLPLNLFHLLLNLPPSLSLCTSIYPSSVPWCRHLFPLVCSLWLSVFPASPSFLLFLPLIFPISHLQSPSLYFFPLCNSVSPCSSRKLGTKHTEPSSICDYKEKWESVTITSQQL